MNIGIIGSGRMGSGLGKIWSKKHRIYFSYSRDYEKLKALAHSCLDARAATPAEAVAASEVVLLATPWSAVTEALGKAGTLDGKVLIDCTNPLLPDLGGLSLGLTTSAAEEIAKMAHGALVVKAFNTAFAEIYHTESRLFGSRRLTMFYCGDHKQAKATVARLINEAGFDPIDAGPLTSARQLEPLAMLMIQLGYGMGMGTNIGISLIRR